MRVTQLANEFMSASSCMCFNVQPRNTFSGAALISAHVEFVVVCVCAAEPSDMLISSLGHTNELN